MSGDVQPRRRKDKRRKKEEEEAGTPPPTLVSPSPDPLAENLTIHVHKEGGTGGHWCARIIFFALLAILVGLIGVILIEHRGAADVDTPIAESRWATVFDGWVDDVQVSHDQADPLAKNEEHHEEEEDEAGSEEASEEADHGDEDAAEESEEEDEVAENPEGNDSNETEGEEDGPEDDQGLDSFQEPEESQEEELGSVEKENEDQLSEEKEQDESKEELENNYSEESNEQEGTDNDEDDNAVLEEIEENTSAEDGENLIEKEEDEIINESENELDASIEGVDTFEGKQTEHDDDLSTEFLGIPGVNEIDDNSAEPLEEVEEEEPEEILNETEIEPEVEEVEEESSSVAVKFGVGAALAVAAHFVLVRRWNNVENNVSQDSDGGRDTPDLSRRKTIVAPPRAEKIISTIAKEQGEACKKVEAESYESLRSKYKKLEVEDDEEPLIKNLGGDLRIEKKPKGGEEEDDEELETSEGERLSGTEEDEVDEEEEEEEDEDEEDEEEEDDAVDDSELVAKLEAKYGKLPTPPESDDEEEEEEEEDEDEEEEEEDENEDDEDIQGWKRVKSPQTAGDASKPAATSRAKPAPKQSGAREFEPDDFTNFDDALIREELDAAEGQTAEKRIVYFTDVLSRYPASPRAKYGLATALDNMAEEKKDNSYLRKAVNVYKSLLELGTLVPPRLFKTAGERCINRLRFSGQYSEAEPVHRKLIARFTDEPGLRNQLAVTYLMQNKLSEARKVLQETLGRWPDDGFALVHYGFVLKTGNGNMNDAIMYLKAGIDTGHEGTIDGRFFFHLGDALVRLGRAEEAKKVYQTGAEKGLFLSAYQRSLYNVDRLTGRPWWTLEETSYKEFFDTLENNWLVIKAEGLAALHKNGQYKNEAENLRDKGSWQQFELFARGRKMVENCAKVPRTCSLIEKFSASSGCRRGQVKFSVMYPGTHVWPHCGPTNCRLRAHLGLAGTEGTYIRVGEETRTWIEGKVMVFDDSFEHEVWHNGTLTRLVLIVDVWHPELLESEKRALPSI